MKNVAFLYLLVSFITVSACRTKKEPLRAAIDSLARIDSTRKVAEALPKDTALDNTARFIAGLPQLHSNSLSVFQKDKYWIDFQTSMDMNWTKMQSARLNIMTQWERDVFSKTVNDSLNLYYPFSGPDFLHANFLYPHTRQYVLTALEPIREVPSIEKLSARDRDRFLDSLTRSLRDVFGKSYFITSHMNTDLAQIKGVLPLFYFFMERSGYELLEQKFFNLDSLGNPVEVNGSRIIQYITPGVKFTLRHRETKVIKTVYYFSVDISNGGLKKRPGYVKFVTALAPFNTFVKSASYLMHLNAFSSMRGIILSNSLSLFQDDTGMPYRFIKNNPQWRGQFFGNYVPPVKDFSRGLFQPSLDSAFKHGAQPLPFSLGYHWSTQKQHYMLFDRKRM